MQRRLTCTSIALLILPALVVLAVSRSNAAEPETQAPAGQPFRVVPADIPNRGILFVDHEANGRSGHGGNCIAECTNGDVIAFYSNVAGDIWGGHGVPGWSEYRRSRDSGKTWGEPVVLDYSKQMWEGDEVYSALVFSVIAAPDGTLIATVVRFENAQWRKQLPPVYLLSRDHGHTWTGPYNFDDDATVDDIAMTFDTSFVHDGEVFVVFMGDARNMCPGPYSLHVSTDNGQSFSKRSDLPFDPRDYYSAAAVLDDGRIIVYSYPYRGRDTDERNMPYVTSKDGGRTWSDIKTAHFAKAIRNLQMSGKIGDYYFLHGRSGSYRGNPGNFVLYASKDGIHWDEGRLLMSRADVPGGGDCYSANEIIGKYDAKNPNRLLIQSSISYSGSRVNIHHWWIENIAGTEAVSE
ncbi:MAG: sialidase family protein [Patescibacteria group bacterium]|nr:sialidase family protein [Patescibacteria group bacterium]